VRIVSPYPQKDEKEEWKRESVSLTKNKPSVKRGLHTGHFYCQPGPSAVNNRISCEIKNYKIE